MQNPAKWSALVKALLKNGLKMAHLGPPCVGLLAAICAKKYRGLEGENTERQLITDMVHSHSGKGSESTEQHLINRHGSQSLS